MTRSKIKILLVNMPFASPAIPSLALTQLKSVVAQSFPDQIQLTELYLNHDFANYIADLDAYRHVLSNYGFMTGIGDWFFRQAAFSDVPDNTAEYFARYYAGADAASRRAWDVLQKHRANLDKFLDALIAKYRMAEADIVGFTALFAQTVASFAMARRLKAANPRQTILMGGAACSGEMGAEFLRRIKSVDYFFSGPGLVSFPEFLKNVLAGNLTDMTDLISGDELDINAPVPLDYDAFLDSLDRAFPAGEVKPVLLFETSRGCWWGAKQRCAFCGLNGPSLRYRAMTTENAVTQIRSLFRYAPRCSFLESVDTILPEDYATTVMPSLQPPSGMKIQYEVRPQFREAELAGLCAAGVTVLQPGIESLSTPTLKLMRKGTTAFQNIRFLKACSRFPLEIGWNLLIGSPGESEATYENYLRVLPLLSHLHPPQTASLVGFVRYSEYHERAREHGLDLQPEDYYRLTFPFDDAAIARVAIKFRDANADADRMNEWLLKLNDAVARWRERWLSESRLCLVREGGAAFVYDSRDGKPVQHALDATTLAALELLEQPRPAAEVGEALAFFRKHGLVFEEDGRCLSLVIT